MSYDLATNNVLPITKEEPRLTVQVAGKPVSFVLDTEPHSQY